MAPIPPKVVRIPPNWTLREAVERLKGQYDMKKKQLELFRQDTQKHRKMTRGVIEDLSDKVHRLRIEFLTDKGDQDAIEDVFADNKKTKLAANRGNLKNAIDMTTHHLSKRKNSINLLKYQIDKMKKDVDDLKKEEKYYATFSDLKSQVKAEEETLRKENQIGYLKIQLETARTIKRLYKQIILDFEKNILAMPLKLDFMTTQLNEKKKDLSEIKAIAEIISKAREAVLEQYNEADKQVVMDKLAQAEDIAQMHKATEAQQNLLNEKPHANQHAKHMVEQELARRQKLRKLRGEKQRVIVQYEEMIERLQDATHNESLEELVDCFRVQEDKTKKLNAMIDEMERNQDILSAQLQQLKEENHALRYFSNTNEISLDALLDTSSKELSELEKKRGFALTALRKQRITLLQLHQGAFAMLAQLRDVIPVETHTQLLHDDLENQWKSIRERVEKLSAYYTPNKPGPGQMYLQLPKVISRKSEYFQVLNFMESKLRPAYYRRNFQKEVQTTSLFDEGSTMAPTRHDIKMRSQKLIASKNKRVGKKKKAK